MTLRPAAVAALALLGACIAAAAPVRAQETEARRRVSVGLLLGRPGGLGAEGLVDFTPRVGALIRGNGAGISSHAAVWLGPTLRLTTDPDIILYAAPLVGMHHCQAFSGGGESRCPWQGRWNLSSAAVAGFQGALTEGGAFSLGVETGAWFVDPPGTRWWIAATMRYAFPY